MEESHPELRKRRTLTRSPEQLTDPGRGEREFLSANRPGPSRSLSLFLYLPLFHSLFLSLSLSFSFSLFFYDDLHLLPTILSFLHQTLTHSLIQSHFLSLSLSLSLSFSFASSPLIYLLSNSFQLPHILPSEPIHSLFISAPPSVSS